MVNVVATRNYEIPNEVCYTGACCKGMVGGEQRLDQQLPTVSLFSMPASIRRLITSSYAKGISRREVKIQDATQGVRCCPFSVSQG